MFNCGNHILCYESISTNIWFSHLQKHFISYEISSNIKSGCISKGAIYGISAQHNRARHFVAP